MRRTVLALALLATLPACSLFRKAKLTDSTPAVTPAQSSTPFGEWVLSTDPNQTAFAGARRVELTLTPRSIPRATRSSSRARRRSRRVGC